VERHDDIYLESRDQLTLSLTETGDGFEASFDIVVYLS
jgi:hypothetical protein